MGELCKECFKKCMNPDATDDFLIMSETFDICERCNNFGPIVLGEGVIDKLGGWHIDGTGTNPLGDECGECGKMTCEGCTNVDMYHQYVKCEECKNQELCTKDFFKEQDGGCKFWGAKDWNYYYHIVPNDNGCVVLAYDPIKKEIYHQHKSYDTADTIVLPTEQAAINWIRYSSILNPIEKTRVKPEKFGTAYTRKHFSQVILKEQ